jgi:FHA domain.
VTSGTIVHAPATGRAPWVFVAGERFIAMVDAATPRSTIDALWTMTDIADPAIEELVGAIPLKVDATHGADSFAIVRFADAAPGALDRSVTVVARGRACVDVFSVGGARRFSSGGVEPWMLAGFRSVVAVGLYGDDVPVLSVPRVPAGALPLRQAAVSGARLLWAHPSLQLPDAADDAPIDRPAAARSSGSAPDDDTILLSRSGTRSAPAKHERITPGPALFTITIGTGAPTLLDGPVVIGRHPAGPRVPSENPPSLVTVPSPHEIVSSSHVRIEPQGESVVVTDLRSTNGTFVTVPGQRRRRIHPGESFVVPQHASIDIGDGNIIEITPSVPDRHSGQPDKAAGGRR